VTKPDRQSLKAARRALAAAGDIIVRRGLRRPHRDDDLVALAYTLQATLTRTGAESGGAAMAAKAWRVFEASLAGEAARPAYACSRGCDHCCHGSVSVTAPEALAIALQLMKPGAEAVRAAFMARAPRTMGLGPAERFGRKIPCALLESGLCSVYVVRPLACRRVVSFAVALCIEELNGVPGDMAVPGPPVAHAVGIQIAMLAALAASGRPPVLYELSAAVARLIGGADLDARWAAGEDVFAGVPLDPITEPSITHRITALADAIRPLAHA
jgi:hypothetical protein